MGNARNTAGTVTELDEVRDDRLIRELLQNWVIWRDAADWDRFRTIWQAVELVMQDQYWNPRPPERDALRAMLGRAWCGEPPQPG